MKKTVQLLMTLALLLPLSAVAQQSVNSDFYVIPAISHGPGANGSMFESDVAIQNISNQPLTVQLVFVESGEGNPDNVFPLTNDTNLNGTLTLPPFGNVLLKDVLSGYRGRASSSGALLIGADRPFAVNSRSYNIQGTATNGTAVAPVRNFLDNTVSHTDLSTASAFIPGLVNNAQFRTNLGFVAANSSGSGETLGVQVILRGADGTNLGSRLFLIPPGQIIHTQFSTSTLTTTANSVFSVAGAEFKIVQGSGAVAPYASVIDNQTNDGSYYSAQFPTSTSLLGRTPGTTSSFAQFFTRLTR